jgi:hypothetical protein
VAVLKRSGIRNHGFKSQDSRLENGVGNGFAETLKALGTPYCTVYLEDHAFHTVFFESTARFEAST